jgi:hypothetical protein
VEQGNTDVRLLLWGAWAFAAVMALAVLAVLVWVWRGFALPVFVEAAQARRTGDWWRPFLPREVGSWGPLCDNRYWSAMRAEQPDGASGLAVRWGFWGLVALVHTAVPLYGLVRALGAGAHYLTSS